MQKNIIYFTLGMALMALIFVIFSPSEPVLDLNEFIQYNAEKKADREILIKRAIVSYTYSQGFVNTGSCLFNIEDAEQGYKISLIENGNEIRTVYCNQRKLDEYINRERYGFSVPDSLVKIEAKK